MCPTDFSFGAPPRVSRRSPVNSSFGNCKILLSERPPTMAYRMKMFKSQKPSSVDLRDLRVSDFKRVPGFNYVSAEDEHTDNSLCALTSERRGPSTRQTACKSTRFPRERRTSRRRLSTRRRCFRASCPFGGPGHPTSAQTWWLAVVEIPSKQQNAPLFGTLEVAAPLSACY